MVIPKTRDEHQTRSSFAGRSSIQQNRSNTSLSHQPEGSQHHNSDVNISPANTEFYCEPQEYAETDFLLPNKLYGQVKTNISGRTKDVDCSAAPAESICSMVLQILGSFLLAGLGTVSAGMLLDVVQNWDVFLEITEIFILVPAVSGLKGNLEMTLASRLSTAVMTIGSTREKWMLIVGNLALKQLQATVMGLLASLMAALLGWMAEGKMPFNHIVLLCSTSVFTAFVASLFQGIMMVAVIIGSKRIGINPDNVATPLAAGFGDLITLALLACCGQWFYSLTELYPYVLYLIDLLLLCLIPLWVAIASQHPGSHILLQTGWEPIITAMIIIHKVFLLILLLIFPFFLGVGGNLVSIQSSRISTHLHRNFSQGGVPEERRSCCNPCYAFFGSGANQRSAKILLLLIIPGQLIFLNTIHLIKGGHTWPSPLLTVAFLSASLIQVFSLLCIADCMVHCLWRRHKDPDSYSIPYLTALGDLLGTALLSLAFLMLWCVGDSGSV
uniref:Solute carrier family 41 member n=1 Tax=Echeneis naucrates TaxID=173247 RepID=A0A665UU72_ECHNA